MFQIGQKVTRGKSSKVWTIDNICGKYFMTDGKRRVSAYASELTSAE